MQLRARWLPALRLDLDALQQWIARYELTVRLKRVLAASGQRTVFFDADEDAEFGRTVEAMDLARAGGAATLVVLTAPLALQAAAAPSSVGAN